MHGNLKRQMIRSIIGIGALAGFLGTSPLPANDAGSKPNVLFIAVDDLRPDLGCYGENRIKSPHIDRLASQGLVFDRAYCQQAICMSSRASVLSGYRPDKGQIYRNGPLSQHVPAALTLNQHNHDFETVVMRTDRHRYTEWRNLKTKAVEACELYDHQSDPGENTNLAGNADQKDLIATLAKQLRDGYQAAKP